MSLSTLNGTFDSFQLPDVLHLVAGSTETGLLRVESDGLAGRVYFVDGEISYATTRAEDHLIDDLANLDHITAEEHDAIERRAVQLEDVRASRKAVLDVFFSHQVTEVLVRLLSLDQGSFTFDHGVMMAHQVGFRLHVDEALDAAMLRKAEWERITEVVPSVDTRFRMSGTIDHDITVDPERWKLLAALPGTARGLALALKTFEFQAAARLADLVRAGLIVPEETEHRENIEVVRPPEPSSELSSEEAAELLGSFIALADVPGGGSADGAAGEAEQIAAPDQDDSDDDEGDEDLPNRWRRLRNRSGG